MRFFLMVLILLGNGCQEGNLFSRQGQMASNAAKPGVAAKKQEISALTAPSKKLKISYELNGFGADHKDKMVSALNTLSQVVNSEAFKDRVLSHEFQGKKGYYKSKGMSNEEIYELILNGAETLSPQIDHTINLRLTLYYNSNNTVGYTYPNTSEIWVNRKYFERYSLAEVANNAIHEWLHKIGFEHSFYNNSDRPFTVPYAIGEIVESIINNSENLH